MQWWTWGDLNPQPPPCHGGTLANCATGPWLGNFNKKWVFTQAQIWLGFLRLKSVVHEVVADRESTEKHFISNYGAIYI